MTEGENVEPVRRPFCEVCGEALAIDEESYGCNGCGKMFGPCCNSLRESYCAQCSDGGSDDD